MFSPRFTINMGNLGGAFLPGADYDPHGAPAHANYPGVTGCSSPNFCIEPMRYNISRGHPGPGVVIGPVVHQASQRVSI